MPVSQLPSPTPEFPATISPPYDADPLSAIQLRVDDLTPLQNGIEAARLLLYGGGLSRRVICASNTMMTIAPMGAVGALLGTKWTVVTHTMSSVIDPAALSGGLVLGTRYWVYARLIAGPAINFVVSTTPPDTGLFYMTGDQSSLWISTFVTVPTSANIMPYTQSNLEFQYQTTGCALLVAGAALVSTNVPLNYTIPAQARKCKVIARTNVTVANRAGLLISPVTGGTVATILDSGAAVNFVQVELCLSQGSSFNYLVSNAATTLDVDASNFSL